MKEMYLEEWKKEVIENPEGLMFDIKCKKCKSKKVIIDGYDDIGQGSEYTGIYGDAGIVIKCKSCGNAYKIIVSSF